MESLRIQKNIDLEIIFLDQSDDNSFMTMVNELNENFAHTFKYYNIPDVSLSFARNYGINIASNNYVAFIDPDAVANEFWAINIVKAFKDEENVGIVGGKILPQFLGNTRWYHKSSYVKEVYSLLDLGDEDKYVSNIEDIGYARGFSFAMDYHEKLISGVTNLR